MAVVYLDSSVAVQAILDTPNRARLIGWLTAPDHRFVSSRLLQTEVIRTLRREGLPPADADGLLDRVNLVAISETILRRAEGIGAHVRTLDAIHLATALWLGFPVLLASHDARMLSVAADLGLDTVDPVAPSRG